MAASTWSCEYELLERVGFWQFPIRSYITYVGEDGAIQMNATLIPYKSGAPLSDHALLPRAFLSCTTCKGR